MHITMVHAMAPPSTRWRPLVHAMVLVPSAAILPHFTAVPHTSHLPHYFVADEEALSILPHRIRGLTTQAIAETSVDKAAESIKQLDKLYAAHQTRLDLGLLDCSDAKRETKKSLHNLKLAAEAAEVRLTEAVRERERTFGQVCSDHDEPL